MKVIKILIVLVVLTLISSARSRATLIPINDPGFELNNGSWGQFGNVAILSYNPDTGANHAAFFGDNVSNSGGFFQQGIAGVAGMRYDLTLRAAFESSWDARTRFGLEFYLGDDSTLITSDYVEINEPLPDTSYHTYTMEAVAPAGTVFVRPIFRFDNVINVQGSSEGAQFDNVELDVVPEPALLGYAAATGAVLFLRQRLSKLPRR